MRWTGAREPLARIAVFGTFRQLRSCGTRRPPPATFARSEWCGPHVCTSSYFCRSRPPLPLTVLGTATMDLSTSQFNVGGKGECAGRMRKPLARIAGRLRSCGTQWPPTFFVWARSVRCVPHVCTSVLLHFTCYAPPPPPDPIIPDATYRNFVSWDPSAPLPW